MKKLTRLIVALTCIICFQNCTNDDALTGGPLTDPQPDTEAVRDEQFKEENFGNTTTGKFIGTITDTSGNKLENVRITIGNAVTMTDRNGLFVLNDVTVFENFAYIQAKKDGYIDGSRVVVPKTDGANRIQIILFEKEVIDTVSSGQTSEVSLFNGTSVTFSGDFITTDGSPYNGAVDVVLNYVQPNTTSTFTQMPGSLFAQTASNEARGLETYGMVSINLFSPAGEPLNINPENPAIITFPIDFTQNDSAPETIPLWYFDEEQGYWKEEGQATKNGNTYVGEVTHFTWWNIDFPLDIVEFCFTLTPTNSSDPVPYYVIIKRVSNDDFIYFGLLSSYETECGNIPQNEEISIAVYGAVDSQSCNIQLIHEEVLGGYATDASADISFQEQYTITPITGIANNCDGNSITNGYLYINDVNTFSITDGTIDIGVQTCATVTEILTLQLFDFDTNQWVTIEDITMDGNAVDIGTVSTCEDTGGTYNGNVQLLTQADVNTFGAVQFSAINGNLYIGDFNNILSSDIIDLSPLASLQNITNGLVIKLNPNLQSLQGLQNITQAGNITISRNDALTTLNGLQNITNTTYLGITDNNQLTSINAISNLTSTLSTLRIERNPVLSSLSGLENMTSISGIVLKSNDAIPDLQPLSNLTELTELYLIGNPLITSLEGLEQITEMRYLWIYGNNNLTSLNGLENLVSIIPSGLPSIAIGTEPTDYGGFAPSPNQSLVDLCALQNLFANGNGTSVAVYIENNAYNPTPQEIANGNCSQ